MQKTCTNCGATFAITDDDLAFLDRVSPTFNEVKYVIPPPTHCPDCRQQRHQDRFTLRNPRKLWARQCVNCQKEVMTTYSPERDEKVRCENCYLKEAY